jgi:putative flavoprotein involved in K+ transport
VSPERILGKSIFWWMDKLGILRKSRESAVGRFLRKADPFPGKGLDLDALKKRGVTVVGRLEVVAGKGAMFAGAETAQVDAVIWATGYRDETGWLAIPEAVTEQGSFTQERGVSPVPGLYFIGRSWQWTRGSALLTGVGADAAYVLQQLLPALDRGRVVDRSARTGVMVAAAD